MNRSIWSFSIKAGFALFLLMGCDRVASKGTQESPGEALPVSALANCYGKLYAGDISVGSGVFIQHIGKSGTVYPYFVTARHVLELNKAFFITTTELRLAAPHKGGGHKDVTFAKCAPSPFIDAQENADLGLIALPSLEVLKDCDTAIRWVVYDGRDWKSGAYDVALMDKGRIKRRGVDIGIETWTFGALENLRSDMIDSRNETLVSVRRGGVAMMPKTNMKLLYGPTPIYVIDSMIQTGDSGAPVFVQDGEKKEWSLLGIVVGHIHSRTFKTKMFVEGASDGKADGENSGYAYVTPGPVLVKMLERLERDIQLKNTFHKGAR